MLADAEAKVGRPIHPTLYTLPELQKRLGDGGSVLERVLEQPKLWVIGKEDELAAIISRHRPSRSD